MKTDTKKPCFVRKYTSSNEIPKLTVNEPDRILVYSGKKKNNYVAQHIEIYRCADYFR